MALFAFMVAALVSALILAAATSSVRQAKLDQENQQNLLILQSAGELIEREVTTSEITITDTLKTNKRAEQDGDIKTEYKIDKSSLISSRLSAAIQATYSSTKNSTNVDYDPKTSFVINTSTSDGFSQDVQVSIKLYGNFHKDSDFDNHLVITLSTSQVGWDSAVHSLVMDFAPNFTNPGDWPALQKNHTYTLDLGCEWEDPSYKIAGGGSN